MFGERLKANTRKDFHLPDCFLKPLTPESSQVIRCELERAFLSLGSYRAIALMDTVTLFYQLATNFNCLIVNLSDNEIKNRLKHLAGELLVESLWEQGIKRLENADAAEYDRFSPLYEGWKNTPVDIIQGLTNSDGVIIIDSRKYKRSKYRKSWQGIAVHEFTEFLVSKYGGVDANLVQLIGDNSYLVMEREIDFVTKIGKDACEVIQHYKRKIPMDWKHYNERSEVIDAAEKFHHQVVSFPNRVIRQFRK